MTAKWGAALALVLVLAGCSGAPPATHFDPGPTDTEPVETEPLMLPETEQLEPTPAAAVSHIDVGVHTALDRDPASTVVNAGETGTGDSGTGSAELNVDGRLRTLELLASTKDGEAVRLRGICRAP